jgi:RNA binding exosome subunit
MTKIYHSFKETFDIDSQEFIVQTLEGHFENPITLLSCKLRKKKAQAFVRALTGGLPKNEIDSIIGDLHSRCDNALHLRISKQSLPSGKIALGDEDSIKLRIYTPVYSQKELLATYSSILSEHS